MSLFPGKEEVLGRKLKELEAGVRLSSPAGTMLTSWSPRALLCKRSLLGSGRSAFASFKGKGSWEEGLCHPLWEHLGMQTLLSAQEPQEWPKAPKESDL